MAETEFSTTTRLPAETIWDFVKDMDRWARFVAGYQGHEHEAEHDSIWTLKGDVGVLSRTLRFRVHVTEWSGPSRVAFTLTGLNEPMRGEGSFEMEPVREGEAAAASGARDGPPPSAPPPGFLARLFTRVFRFFFRRARGRVERETPPPGAAAARMRFLLRLEPGGPMAPMIDAMIHPAMAAAAEDLATRIIAQIEAENAGKP